jgi:hypothetical protein
MQTRKPTCTIWIVDEGGVGHDADDNDDKVNHYEEN